MSITQEGQQIRIIVNDEEHVVKVKPYESLNKVLREHLGLTGTKFGCDYGGCGSCTVLVEGSAVYSCMYPAAKAEGKRVTTVEGLAQGERLHTIQESFVNNGGLQCGYCTPGFIMATKALLDKNPDCTEEDIRYAISGTICRCTGYVKIIQSIQEAASSLRTQRGQGVAQTSP